MPRLRVRGLLKKKCWTVELNSLQLLDWNAYTVGQYLCLRDDLSRVVASNGQFRKCPQGFSRQVWIFGEEVGMTGST